MPMPYAVTPPAVAAPTKNGAYAFLAAETIGELMPGFAASLSAPFAKVV